MTAILALKNKDSKTLCHIEISKLGSINQHYSKANSPVKMEYWKYVNEFFKTYEDKIFNEKVNEMGVEMVYDVRNDSRHTFLPSIKSYVPTQYTSSIFDSKRKKFTSTRFVKEFLNTNSFRPEELYDVHYGDVEGFLSNLKEFINKSIDDMLDSIKSSSNNFLVLSDDMIKKIYGKLHYSTEQKLERLAENSMKKGHAEPAFDGLRVNEVMERPGRAPYHIIMEDEEAKAELNDSDMGAIMNHIANVGRNQRVYHEEEYKEAPVDCEGPMGLKEMVRGEIDKAFGSGDFGAEDDVCEEKMSESDMGTIEFM